MARFHAHFLTTLFATLPLAACIGNDKMIDEGPTMRHPAHGPSAPEVLASYIGSTQELVVRGQYVYALQADRTATTGLDGRVMRVPKTGGAPVEVATKLRSPKSLRLSTKGFLWLEGSDTTDNDLRFLELVADVEPISLARGPGYGAFAIVGPYAYVAGPTSIDRVSIETGEREPMAKEGGARLMEADLEYLFFLSGSDLKRISIAGDTATRLASGGQPRALALDEKNVYFITQSPGDGGIFRIPKRGGEVVPVVKGLNGPTSIAVDAEWIYWTNENLPEFPATGNVMRIAKTGGTPSVLVSGNHRSSALAQDEDFVYWVERDGDGSDAPVSLRRAAK